MWSRRLLLVFGGLVASVAAVLALAPAASAQTPCWEKVLLAWSQNDLHANFPIHCYETAVSKLPADLRGYSSAAADIQRALLAAIRDRAPSRSTASVHHGTLKSASSPSTLGVVPSSPEKRALPLPLPLLILAGWIVVSVGSLLFLRRGRRARRSRGSP
jgi:hypothetical protein